ncbi:Hsp20/alpha crystallin family protein [Anaerobacillus sp. HL2]|nr:Hsp20/alpha crystallin family protein [Anaerobacillus sp. HL2]
MDNIENVNVKVNGNTVEIDGNLDVQFDNFNLTHMEFSNGEFQRTIQLSYSVREDKVDAVYKQGLLIIHLIKSLLHLKMVTEFNK